MTADPNEPVILTSAKTEAVAQLIVGALEDQGIYAQTTGGLTAGFKAEAPGEVRILVRQSDLARAQAAWKEIEPELEREHSDDEE